MFDYAFFYEIEKEMDNDEEMLSISSSNNMNYYFEEPFSYPDKTSSDTFHPNNREDLNRIRFVTFKKAKNLVGRKRNSETHHNYDDYDYDYSVHSKFRSDNLLTKIQVNFLTFLVIFINEILGHMGIKGEFSQIDYSHKKRVTKKYISYLKGLNIGQVLLLGISPKYIKKDTNRNLYDKIIKNPVICNILSENYLTIFKNIYLRNERIVNMEKYGLNKIFELSNNVKMYDDLIDKMKEKYGEGTYDCQQYIISLNNCADNYLKTL